MNDKTAEMLQDMTRIALGATIGAVIMALLWNAPAVAAFVRGWL